MPPKRHGRKWTGYDDGYLREHYADTPVSVLAEQLQRTETSVRSRARALALRKDYNAQAPQRFELLLDRSGECWIFTGNTNDNGYGRFHVNGSQVPAHRYAYELWVAPIPEGMVVCHACDTPLCVRPDHLWLGTLADNNLDMALKGRARNAGLRGEEVGSAKLTAAQVQEMRRMYESGRFTQPELAEQFGVSPSQANNVLTGRQWGHLPGSPDRAECNVRRGERAHNAVLTEDKVRTIRQWSEAGKPYSKIAEAFGTSVTNVFNVVHRNTWKHVDPAPDLEEVA